MKRIAVIGNAGGGKRRFHASWGRRLLYLAIMSTAFNINRARQEQPKHGCGHQLDTLISGNEWIIDDFGGDEVIER